MIGLLDANNFFVSCERLFRPDLERKPVAVLSGNDGCIVARSNEVKAMGVPMGMPLFQAKKLADLSTVTFFSSNFTLYRDISQRVMDVLAGEVGPVQQYSIDESFFTLSDTTTKADMLRLRERIMSCTGIPVSIGVAASKTLAKAASGLAKKDDGALILDAQTWEHCSQTYTTSDVWNLGRATSARLKSVGVTTAADFMALDRSWVSSNFGVGGCRLYDELRGIVVYPVVTTEPNVQQSITSTRSFAKTITKKADLQSALGYHVLQVAEKLRAKKLLTTRLQIVARASRHGDFAYRKGAEEIILEVPSNDTRLLLKAALHGLECLYDPEVPYKKAGVIATGIVPAAFVQTDLFTRAHTENDAPKTLTLDAITDTLNRRFGGGTVRPAVVDNFGSRTSAVLRSARYTTAWRDIPRVKATERMKDKKVIFTRTVSRLSGK